MPFALTSAALLALLLAGCNFSTDSEPDPPPVECSPGEIGAWSWEDAQPIDDFTQEEREGDVISDTAWESSVSASSAAPGLRVAGDYLPFMCGEAVEGFYRKDGEQVIVLVQPVDMEPDKETCGCLYGVEGGIPEDPPVSVSLYRRSHNCCGNEYEPELIGCVKVEP